MDGLFHYQNLLFLAFSPDSFLVLKIFFNLKEHVLLYHKKILEHSIIVLGDGNTTGLILDLERSTASVVD